MTITHYDEQSRAAFEALRAENAELRGLLAETVPDPEYRRMQDIEIERLREALEKAQGGVTDYAKQYVALRAENDRLREALESIKQWAEAYPLDIFPEPDLKRAHEVLTAHGMTIDSISASASRHVLKGVIKIIDGQ